MNVYAGLDVSLKETAVCIVDEEGRVVSERKVLSEPKDLDETLRPYGALLRRVGIEASAVGGWLQLELSSRGFEAVLIEAHHTHVSLSTMRNKTDRNDARGIAHLMRLGWFKAVHVKSDQARRLRMLLGARRHIVMLLGARRHIVRKLVDTENE